MADDDLHSLHEFIDKCVSDGPGKMFACKPTGSSTVRAARRKLHARIRAALVELHACRSGGAVAPSACVLYEAMVYKFGPANRHQKFWRTAHQLYRTLKKMNRQSLVKQFNTFVEKLENSEFAYRPTKRAVCFLGALLLRRIVQLDRLRLGCARSADSSMGYIELHHLLTINLMSLAIVSDIARQAALHMQHLSRMYLSLNKWFRRHSKRFPASLEALQLRTVQADGLAEPRNESKFLTEHDLAILRTQIEGIGRSPTDADVSNMNLSFAMRNPALGRFVNMRPKQQKEQKQNSRKRRHND